MTSFSSLMGNQTLLPIIQADSPEQGVAIAKAMSDAGLKLVEVVLRTEASLAALTAIKSALPELIVGAGTVTNETILKQAIDAGADFIITPAVSEKLLTHLADCGLPVLPGVSNTGEILMACEFGYKELKLFPAALSGGHKFLAAVSSIFQGVKFCPTGGVTAENKVDYLTLNNVFAVGGTWVAKKDWVDTSNWQAITDACIAGNL
ncbi:bifunctional 4-hydroxy-2-oxoglutarate aldolase/2-dehydro-3-deoxy-phosphogluconate aldolase [Thalassotalea sp. M1531]|uniref:Bifunctional 4-hydroxy-2-oxoglutarate aldolase/2-dehydro-3-deoxy-phosphogluconate aldolase n=1 Tax=Thalassotalea algicola TaxID=2716224 RepID=A0A7Y0LDS8_9GAMM|nr:bifunctional 4-hydroxy-2-oxoglutarate aldolase/2-dehydro-3-deoxy-phosphogluconate aldolase [Thalassotalea algicola]NMP32591.1 bifunctional 4-hydroxy-2-oxoglutarate aldolase/2-dehydro-3-deoxy-phosphogluconate aldolase [Thalassotalea algicola]